MASVATAPYENSSVVPAASPATPARRADRRVTARTARAAVAAVRPANRASSDVPAHTAPGSRARAGAARRAARSPATARAATRAAATATPQPASASAASQPAPPSPTRSSAHASTTGPGGCPCTWTGKVRRSSVNPARNPPRSVIPAANGSYSCSVVSGSVTRCQPSVAASTVAHPAAATPAPHGTTRHGARAASGGSGGDQDRADQHGDRDGRAAVPAPVAHDRCGPDRHPRIGYRHRAPCQRHHDDHGPRRDPDACGARLVGGAARPPPGPDGVRDPHGHSDGDDRRRCGGARGHEGRPYGRPWPRRPARRALFRAP